MYGLRASISGHSADVRCMIPCNYPMNGGFVTGGRDNDAKLWFPSGTGPGYEMLTHFRGSTHWVASLAYMEPDADNINGLLFVGSFDSKIRVYDPLKTEAQQTYSGHGQTVCALAVNKATQTLVSGSWDKTVKVWRGAWGSLDKKNTKTISQIHQGSVLALQILEDDSILTACADKLIRLFNKDGELQKTFEGHTDVVQTVTLLLNGEEFLSGGNDMIIRKWNLESGECTGTFSGHEAFIYSISVLPRNKGFISSGEDRSLRVWVWDEDEPSETIMLPATSAWCTAALPMGDIAVGLSDASARVFTYRDRFLASPEEIAAFETLVAETKLPAQLQQGGVDPSKLAKSVDGLPPGTKEGETKMVNGPGGITAYQWSKGKWEQIGQVVGASGKETFDGKEYDFIFNVDLEDGKPAIKLPYNLTEDPWRAAQNFIHNNKLPIVYLEQVANFIINNTAKEREERAVKVVENPNAGDPLTSSGAYKPDYSSAAPKKTKKGGAADPFTGSGAYKPEPEELSTRGGTGANMARYIPGEATLPAGEKIEAVKGDMTTNPDRYIPEEPKIEFVDIDFFPEKKYQLFDEVKPSLEKILNALKEKCAGFNIFIDEEELRTLGMMTDESCVVTADSIFVLLQCLMKIGQKNECVFPLIDLIRLMIKNYSVNTLLCGGDRGMDFIRPILRYLMVEKPAAVPLLSLRVIANMFAHPEGSKLAIKHHGEIITRVRDTMPIQPKPPQKIAFATILLNFTIACREHSASVDIKLVMLDVISSKIGPHETDHKVLIRLLIALGTIVYQDITICQAANSMGTMEDLLRLQKNYKGSSETIAKNIAGCARKVIKEINKNIQVAMDNSMDIDAGPSSSK